MIDDVHPHTQTPRKQRFRVKELAQSRGWSKDDLARKSGVKFSTVQRIWQNRTANPLYDTLKALALALEVTVDELEQKDPSQLDERIPALNRKNV
jgi:transcriptional regulator with XRE-family HTH domain